MFKMPTMPKGETKKEPRTIYGIQDSMYNDVQPDLFSVNGDVHFHQYVKEINGVKEILYDATIVCDIEQFIELRVRLGKKGYNTITTDEEKK